MGYTTASGRWANTEDLPLAPSAARTTTANGAAIEVGDKGVARLALDVTARTGTTPTLDVTIQTSFDGVTWRTAGTFTQATAVGTQRASFNIDRFVRATWTIGGTTPNFTFSVTGEAV
jgi:hypothetical protein